MSGERKKALVTGAASGIGRSAAIALARAGYDVGINYSSSDKAAAATAAEARKLGAAALLLKCDVSDEAGVRAMLKQVEAEFGIVEVAPDLAAGPFGETGERVERGGSAGQVIDSLQPLAGGADAKHRERRGEPCLVGFEHGQRG